MKKFFMWILLAINLIFANYSFSKEIQGEEVFRNKKPNVQVSIISSKNKYLVKEPLDIKFIVENDSESNIYLVVGEDLAYGYNKNTLHLMMEKRIFSYHTFDFPKLIKLEPGKKHIGNVDTIFEPPQDFLDDHLSTNFISLSISVGYLDSKSMKYINKLLKNSEPDALARPFDELQVTQESEPITIQINVLSPKKLFR